jgi:hypothetical protein
MVLVWVINNEILSKEVVNPERAASVLFSISHLPIQCFELLMPSGVPWHPYYTNNTYNPNAYTDFKGYFQFYKSTKLNRGNNDRTLPTT